MGSISKIFFVIFMISVLLLPIFAHSYTLLEPLPGKDGDLTEDVTLRAYLQWLFNFALIVTGFLAVLMIVIGGIRYMIGGAKESERSEGKKQISSALWGLLLALGAWLILYTINPDLIKLDFALPEPKIKAPSNEQQNDIYDPNINPGESTTDHHNNNNSDDTDEDGVLDELKNPSPKQNGSNDSIFLQDKSNF